ncbi:Zinc resistance conferring protein, partial [Kickxella alabastrina]
MLKLSRSAKVSIMLGLSATMFFVELVVGIIAGSITLIADSFHMLNDVLGMVIALWAIKVAGTDKVVPNNTYGWQRAEILGALTNGVLLLGLCLTIYIDVIERFINIEEMKSPKLVMIVGCIGLTFNLMGLVLFHEHGHGHGHSHGHSHAHVHGDEVSIVDEEEGLISSRSSVASRQRTTYAAIDMSPEAETNIGSGSRKPVQSSAVDNRSIIGVPHPVYTQQAIIKSAQMMQGDEGSDESAATSAQASGYSSPRIAPDGHQLKQRPKKQQRKKRRSSNKHTHDHGSGGSLNMHG